ncbi:hypothetical protein Plec18167_004964 [Paecilomyces lecythidis]|uniref:Uncharacterized protein n=1 Tax=Paecilomyces lecythidis TaxID=3004212 RepID=A0ABR3XNG7_9EURO
MAHYAHGLSRTLPKNFTFPSVEAVEPTTPKRKPSEPTVPPPPRYSSCHLPRSRVRSQTNVLACVERDFLLSSLQSPDVPLPSIEVPTPAESQPMFSPVAPVPNDHLLVPPRGRIDLRTPPAQIRTSPIYSQSTSSWRRPDAQSLGDSIARPSSACSNISDSSVSSIETAASQTSLGGSCTSVESEDPFVQYEITRKAVLESPYRPSTLRRRPLELPKKERWTVEMDNHLWNTYQIYLQDPTITPFKMTPGSIPPLGVSHRVAREAKRTWPRIKRKSDRPQRSGLSQMSTTDDATLGEGQTVAAGMRSGSSTPTAKASKAKPLWPRSEASTRKRLKLLCRRKFSIAPHYQRLLQSRSPSPFIDPFARSSREPSQGGLHSNSTSFATRDLGISLVSSSLPGPLSQLATEDYSSRGSEHMFNQPVPPTIQVEDRSDNPRPVVGVNLDPSGPIPRLGSPFKYHTWGPERSRHHIRLSTPVNQRDTIHVTGSRLRSPARRQSFSSVQKRRAQYQLEEEVSLDGSDIDKNIQDLLHKGKIKDIGHRRVRVRNRGNTTGAVNIRGQLDQLFSPVSPWATSEADNRTPKPTTPSNGLLQPGGETIKRLGSPFELDGLKRNTTPARSPRHAPSLSDPFVGGAFSTRPAVHGLAGSHERKSFGALPYDPTEEGISDAERIRRQILNMPFTRK